MPWEEGSSSEDLSESGEDADELLQEDEDPNAGIIQIQNTKYTIKPVNPKHVKMYPINHVAIWQTRTLLLILTPKSHVFTKYAYTHVFMFHKWRIAYAYAYAYQAT